MSKREMPTLAIDPASDDFAFLCICAVRYAIGRRTYIPSVVQGFIRPLLPYFSGKNLAVLQDDIVSAGKYGWGYGDPQIDEPGWMRFLGDIRVEQERRKTK